MHINRRPHHRQDCVAAQPCSLQRYLWCLIKVSVKHMFANFVWASQIEKCNFQQYLSFPSLFQSYKLSLHHIPPWTGAKQPIKSFPFDMLAAWVVLTWQKTFLIWTSSSASLSRQKSHLLLLVWSVLCIGALSEQRSSLSVMHTLSSTELSSILKDVAVISSSSVKKSTPGSLFPFWPSYFQPLSSSSPAAQVLAAGSYSRNRIWWKGSDSLCIKSYFC